MTQAVELSDIERSMYEGECGRAVSCAMRVVVNTATLVDADSLADIASMHIDGCLYHGDSGVYFLERLVSEGGKVAVSGTLNVSAVDTQNHGIVRADIRAQTMARRLMKAHAVLGCGPACTCAPYQVGHPHIGATDCLA